MRWAWTLLVIGAGCFQPAAELDAGQSAIDAGVIEHNPDAAVPMEEPDPCAWDGKGEGLCFAETAWVFDGASCRSVCGGLPELGRPGVFANEWECQATCPCAPEKFVAFPPGAAGPLELGRFCDGLYSATERDAGAPWERLSCHSDGLPGTRFPEVCLLAVHGLDRRAMSRACRASVQPQVREVVCYVWVD